MLCLTKVLLGQERGPMCPSGCSRYVDFCMGRVELLRRNGVVPVIVFDGGRLPMKAGEEGARQRYFSAVSAQLQPSIIVQQHLHAK